MNKRTKKPCPYCGKERERALNKVGVVGKVKPTCGSLECVNIRYSDGHKKLSIIAKKKGFGKWMAGKKLSRETRDKISESNTGRIFSKEVRDKISKAVSGNKNGSWKGGISTVKNKIRNSAEYREWRFAVYKRDNFKCQVCRSSEKINAHHIISFSNQFNKHLEVYNGITMCKKCHTDLHKQRGHKTTLDDFLEFFKSFHFPHYNLKGEKL